MKVKLNGNDFYEVSSPFASLDVIHKTPHTGIDLVMNEGTSLFSPVDGVVKKVVDYGSENIGKGIFIETNDHQTVIMGHLSDSKVSIGQKVSEGDFVALSGNTGHSTGSHLHLGLKDSNGSFINPEKLVNNTSGVTSSWKNDDMSTWEFMKEWKNEGFWQAMYGKPFFEVLKDFFANLGHDIGIFILENTDLFFLLPAVVLLLATWMIGRNKYTKFIFPLFFAYFVSRVLYFKFL